MNIQFNAYEHDECNDSQLIIAISGSTEYIKDKLRHLAASCETLEGKPNQGIYVYGDGTLEVITPIWKGKKY